MFDWGIVLGSLALCALLLLLDSRRSEQGVLRDWDLLLTPKGRREMETAQRRVSAELELVDMTYESAHAARARGSADEALRLLELGCQLIEQYCPTMLRALAAMSVLSRMVSALAPPRPLPARAFRLRELAGWALLNQFLQQFLVGTAERFRLHLIILERGFMTVLRVVLSSTRRAHAGSDALGAELQRIDAARSDVRSLSNESLEAFRLLLEGLAAERR